MPKKTKASSKKKMPSAPILSPRSNVKGIGAKGWSFNNLVPLRVDPKYGSSTSVAAQILRPDKEK